MIVRPVADPGPELCFRLPPYPHQLSEWEISKALEGYALWWEMGTGKSCATIGTAAYLYLTGQIDGVVILAPNSVHVNWTKDEIPTHLPDAIQAEAQILTWYSAKGNQVGTKKALKALLACEGLSVMAMSYNSLMTEAGAKAVKAMLTKRRCLYIFDESGRFKNPGAKRSKRVMASCTYAPFRRVLTGTPVDNSPFDVFTGIKAIRPDIWAHLGMRTFASFKQAFGMWERRVNQQQGRQFDVLIRYRNLKQLKEIVDSVGSRLLKADVLDLPEKLYQKHYFDLDGPQTKAYKALEKDYRAFLDGGDVVTADLALTRMLRMQQITSGFVGNDDDELVPLGERTRLKAFEQLLEDIGDTPTIVFAKYSQEIDDIAQLLGNRCVTFDGRTNDDDRARALQQFQKDRTKQFFVAKPSAAGEGLTLHTAKVVVYYSNSFSLRERLQSEDRAHRAGMSGEHVLYIDLLARETIDEYVLDALRNKRNLAAAVTGDDLPTWA
jgi:SNF2 family DNA or RNA helicase